MNQMLRTMARYIPAIDRLVTQRNEAVAAKWEAIRKLEEAEQARWDALKKLEVAEQAGFSVAGATAEASQGARQPLERLEGTPYSRYAVPIEYLPSRDFRPRWGYARPPEPVLEAWFQSHQDEYVALMREMRSSAGRLKDIPLVFDDAKLPQPAWTGVPYAPFDSVALYTMIQRARPRLYLEIGSGITTCFAWRAIADGELPTKIMSIDPEPRARIDSICDTIVREGLETCDPAIFDQLQAGDILFFDGSHRSFMNSDVTVFMIDVLPRLKPGVIVHIHDIMLPYDYPDSFKTWYWNEQYLLAIYLMGNRQRIRPLLPTAFICRDPAFEAEHTTPMIDLGTANDGWRGGGAMWFTHLDEIAR